MAWDRLSLLYAPLVFHWCRRRGLREADAADIVQDVFQAVATHLQPFRKQEPADTFRGWLRTITENKIHDHFRRRRTRPTRWEAPSATPTRPASGAVGLGERLVRRGLGRALPPPRPRCGPPGVRGTDLAGVLAHRRRGPPPPGSRPRAVDEPGCRPRREVACPASPSRGVGSPRPVARSANR